MASGGSPATAVDFFNDYPEEIWRHILLFVDTPSRDALDKVGCAKLTQLVIESTTYHDGLVQMSLQELEKVVSKYKNLRAFALNFPRRGPAIYGFQAKQTHFAVKLSQSLPSLEVIQCDQAGVVAVQHYCQQLVDQGIEPRIKELSMDCSDCTCTPSIWSPLATIIQLCPHLTVLRDIIPGYSLAPPADDFIHAINSRKDMKEFSVRAYSAYSKAERVVRDRIPIATWTTYDYGYDGIIYCYHDDTDDSDLD